MIIIFPFVINLFLSFFFFFWLDLTVFLKSLFLCGPFSKSSLSLLQYCLCFTFWFFGHEPYRISEKAMAPHSSTLAWKIPWVEEPVRLQSMGSLGVGHDWATSLSLFTFMHGRRKWQPTPVFSPGESQGRRSLVGCRLWGRTESDRTEVS